jgi:hypothetical protein
MKQRTRGAYLADAARDGRGQEMAARWRRRSFDGGMAEERH